MQNPDAVAVGLVAGGLAVQRRKVPAPVIDGRRFAHIFAHQEAALAKHVATNRKDIVARLEREGWMCTHGGEHDKFKHPNRKERIIIPRHNTLSKGVARQIAKIAGW
jgi:predicted RNA binding protein YcfA (HicA-like mRNA interferase family)